MKVLVFNSVNYDGIGDFSHFKDILTAYLKNPKFRDVEFLPIVAFDTCGAESNYSKLKRECEHLGLNILYGTLKEHQSYILDTSIQEKIKDANQALIISYDIGLFKLYAPYLNKNIPIKSIAEHESNIGPKFAIQHNLGLGSSCDGIKIADITPQSPENAWEIIKTNDEDFFKTLLLKTASQDIAAFNKNYLMTPAYFNLRTSFACYLAFLSNNTPPSKHIFVYLSGISDHAYCQHILSHYLANTKIKEIEYYNYQDDSTTTLQITPAGHHHIKIFTGFFLSNLSFDALYQLSKIAGVSGDNTFERCVAMNVLPYYWSTNWRNKLNTLKALEALSQHPQLNISEKAKQSFNIFFNTKFYLNLENGKDINDPIDIPSMVEAWPIICDYLRKHNNFYDCLEYILIEKITFEALPKYFQNEEKARFVEKLEQHQEKLNKFLDDIDKLKNDFNDVPDFKSYLGQLHQNLSVLKHDFFKKGENINAIDFIEFETLFKKNIKEADEVFLLASERAWYQNIIPVLREFLGVLGISPNLIAQNPSVRDIHMHRFFRSDSQTDIANKEKWKGLKIKQKLFENNPENEQPSLFDEIRENVTEYRHKK
jgi:hypothetical protein